MGDHVLTLVAYLGVGVATGWWFWRAHAGVLNSPAHAAVSVLFGLLWPVSLLWHALVRATSQGIAGRRVRRMDPPVDDPVRDM